MTCTILGHVDGDQHRKALARIAELEAAVLEAVRHGERNGMGDWPVFERMRKILRR